MMKNLITILCLCSFLFSINVKNFYRDTVLYDKNNQLSEKFYFYPNGDIKKYVIYDYRNIHSIQKPIYDYNRYKKTYYYYKPGNYLDEVVDSSNYKGKGQVENYIYYKNGFIKEYRREWFNKNLEDNNYFNELVMTIEKYYNQNGILQKDVSMFLKDNIEKVYTHDYYEDGSTISKTRVEEYKVSEHLLRSETLSDTTYYLRRDGTIIEDHFNK